MPAKKPRVQYQPKPEASRGRRFYVHDASRLTRIWDPEQLPVPADWREVQEDEYDSFRKVNSQMKPHELRKLTTSYRKPEVKTDG